MSQDPRALLQKADKALSGAGGGFSFFGGREDKYQNAADLYIQAGNAFRVQKQMKEAGQALEKAAQIQTKHLNEPDDAANTLVDAFKAYRKDDPVAAARCLDVSINRYTSKGNFRRAASHKDNLGELFEVDLGDFKRALECYEAAANWYEGDNASALANKLWIKAADLAALDGDYYKAIENYEKVATASIQNALMKYSVKDYFLKAGICHLATRDMVAAQRAFNKYIEMDPSFKPTRENALLQGMYEALEGSDTEKFSDRVFEYHNMSELDRWKTTILKRIKDGIAEPEDEFA